MTLPNFICPGVQKAATTTLHYILVQHPDIFLPRIKETHFFDIDRRFERGLDYYEHNYYSEVDGEEIVGDITPRYIYYHHVPHRIRRALGPDVKFVILLRNPVDRAYSNYWMTRGRSHETEPFEVAVDRELAKLRRLGPRDPARYQTRSYIDRGFYCRQVERFLDLYPRDQLLFLLFEDFVSNLEETSREILAFLGVATDVELEFDQQRNPARQFRSRLFDRLVHNRVVHGVVNRVVPGEQLREKLFSAVDELNLKPLEKPTLSPDMRRRLIEMYRDDIRRLEEIIDRDLDHWLE